jgi:polyphosphate glucokinase
MLVLGVDIGGTSIKAGLVDTQQGQLRSERLEIETPDPHPENVILAVGSIVNRFKYNGPLGVGVPCVALDGRSRTPFAAYQVQEWVGYPVAERVREVTGCPTLLINDADAAGTAEIRFGAGQGQGGVVIVLTIGTGIGSAVFVDGALVPNTEFGHLYMRDQRDVVENQVSERARLLEGLSLGEWAARLNTLLNHLYRIFSPTLFILGGGIAERGDFQTLISTGCPVRIAQLGNSAGVIGCALGAYAHVQGK